jgi:hypothetical protein
MALLKKLKERRSKRKAVDKWVLGEKLSKAGRERARRRKMMKKVGGKITSKIPVSKKATKTVQAKKTAMGIKSKVKKKDLAKKGSELTKAGVYPKYKTKSQSAGSFRSAFSSNCKGKGSGATFSWQGRSYSCAKKSDTKKAAPAKKKEVQGPPAPTSKKGIKSQTVAARRSLHKAEGRKFYEKFSKENKAKFKKSKKTGKSAY